MMENQRLYRHSKTASGAYLVKMSRLIDGIAVTKRWGMTMANEKRLIDADAFLEKMKRTSRYFDVVFDVEEMPTVDAVEVVHCKDCIRRYDTDECPMCFLSEGQYYEFTRDDGFCDRGERKDNG